MRKVIQMSQRQISGNGEEKSMSLQEVFLVNHSPSQAKERERMITAISGLTCSGPYMRSGPIGSLVRTLLASSRWYSPVRRLKWEVNPLYSERVSLYLKDDSNMLLKPFAVILNAKDIPSSRYLYRLVPVGAPHRRDRVWFIAHRDGTGLQAQGAGQQAAGTTGDNPWNASANASGNRDTPCRKSQEMEIDEFILTPCPDSRREESQRPDGFSGLLRDTTGTDTGQY